MFFENLEQLCKANNTSVTAIVKDLGLSTSLVTNWRRGTIPNGETIIMLANYFHTTTDYLLLGDKKISELQNHEKEWLHLYNQLSEHNKIECIGFIKGYIAAQNNETVKSNVTHST